MRVIPQVVKTHSALEAEQTLERSVHTARAQGKIRYFAPDFARGFTLLGIAVVSLMNGWLAAPDSVPGAAMGGVVDDCIKDKFSLVLVAIFHHSRGLPMFATMLGFGVGLISQKLWINHYPLRSAIRLIARRYSFLVLLGAIHMIFLFWGDILFFYGLAAMVLALFIAMNDRTLLLIAAAGLVTWCVSIISWSVLVLFAGPISITMAPTDGFDTKAPETYTEQLSIGTLKAIVMVPSFLWEGWMLLPLIIIGFVVARRGIIAEPERHKKILIWATVVAIVLSTVLGLLSGLSAIGVWIPTRYALGFQLLNYGLGVLTGPGIIAGVALASIPFQRKMNAAWANGESYKLPILLRPIQALGERSLTGYILFSIISTLFFAKWGLGWAQGKGAFNTVVAGFGLWLVVMLMMWFLAYLKLPGPFEYLLRRLTYGRSARISEYVSEEALTTPVAKPEPSP